MGEHLSLEVGCGKADMVLGNVQPDSNLGVGKGRYRGGSSSSGGDHLPPLGHQAEGDELLDVLPDCWQAEGEQRCYLLPGNLILFQQGLVDVDPVLFLYFNVAQSHATLFLVCMVGAIRKTIALF